MSRSRCLFTAIYDLLLGKRIKIKVFRLFSFVYAYAEWWDEACWKKSLSTPFSAAFDDCRSSLFSPVFISLCYLRQNVRAAIFWIIEIINRWRCYNKICMILLYYSSYKITIALYICRIRTTLRFISDHFMKKLYEREQLCFFNILTFHSILKFLLFIWNLNE